MIPLMLSLLAQAGDVGHVHPPEIAARSALYTQASEVAGTRFRDVQGRVQAVADALTRYRTALDLMGARAPDDAEERLVALRTRFNREKAVVQAFAATMMEDFDGEFSAALARAVPEGAQTCNPTIQTAPAMPGMPAPSKKNPDCKGPSLSADVAAEMDEDPELKAAIEEILALEWPEITLEPEARPAVGPDGGWVGIAPWFQASAPKALERIASEDEQARLPFEAAIEEGASKQELSKLVAEANAVTKATSGKRADLARPVLEAVDRWNDKRERKGRATVAWCANPELFGGCAGEDLTADLGPELREDRRVQKALP